MAKKDQPEPRKYVIKNVHKGPVHVKELRKALSPGKEVEWEGVLGEGTMRLKDNGLLSIDDAGASTKKPKLDPLAKSKASEAREKELTAQAREKLEANPNPKKESKGTAEPVKASDMGVEDEKPAGLDAKAEAEVEPNSASKGGTKKKSSKKE
jgi:hypothetical protein